MTTVHIVMESTPTTNDDVVGVFLDKSEARREFDRRVQDWADDIGDPIPEIMESEETVSYMPDYSQDETDEFANIRVFLRFDVEIVGVL